MDLAKTPPPLRQESVIVATEWTVLPAEQQRYLPALLLAINPAMDRQETLRVGFPIGVRGVAMESACIQLRTAPCRCSGRWDH
jgi:hypothetical protein